MLHQLGDVEVLFRGGLKVGDVVLTRQFECLRFHDGTVLLRVGVRQVHLVAHEDFGEGGVRRVPVDAIDPRAHVLERLPIRQIEGDYHAVCLLIELLGDGVESFLASGVPHLHIDFVVLTVSDLRLHLVLVFRGHIVDSDGLDVGFLELVAGKPTQAVILYTLTVRGSKFSPRPRLRESSH